MNLPELKPRTAFKHRNRKSVIAELIVCEDNLDTWVSCVLETKFEAQPDLFILT